MILYISDFDLKGSGYANIALALCSHLARAGYDVQALGLGYKGEEHDFPFRIAPMGHLTHIVTAIQQLTRQEQIECMIVALDVPHQEALLAQIGAPSGIPYIGLFPLEAPPLCQTWALSLMRMDARLLMSHFAVEACEASGVSARFIPIGVDCESWRPPTGEERSTIRQGLGFDDDTFVVLTVADNQERKNLSRAMEIFAGAFKDKNARYILVTRPNSPVGWKLDDLALDLGIHKQMQIYERGMPFKRLWSLFAASDVFLLTSKAEGLAMPVLEAMAMRLPVVGTRCAAIEEHLGPGRGICIEPDYVYIDPFGNGKRYLAGLENGIRKIKVAYELFGHSESLTPPLERAREEIPRDAQAYARARTWDAAGQVLVETIEKVTKRNGKTKAPAIIETPATELVSA